MTDLQKHSRAREVDWLVGDFERNINRPKGVARPVIRQIEIRL
jgi:hypothetical protein